MWIKQKKTCCFSSQIFTFFLKKNAGSSTGKFRMKKWKKMRSKKNALFAPEVFGLLDVQYYCGILFWYNYWCPESLEYIRPLHSLYGRPLFQKVPKILPKNRLWGILPKAKCCSVWVQQNFFLSEINFICMNFIRLQGLAAGTVSGRNNGLLSCYVEFPVRAKTGFSFS